VGVVLSGEQRSGLSHGPSQGVCSRNQACAAGPWLS